MTTDEIMMMVIESGGSLTDFIDKIFPNQDIQDIDDEDEEMFHYRRKMEDEFIAKKREWKKTQSI